MLQLKLEEIKYCLFLLLLHYITKIRRFRKQTTLTSLTVCTQILTLFTFTFAKRWVLCNFAHRTQIRRFRTPPPFSSVSDSLGRLAWLKKNSTDILSHNESNDFICISHLAMHINNYNLFNNLHVHILPLFKLIVYMNNVAN